jgi:membrane protein implicated in regulation of membrane protease activity
LDNRGIGLLIIVFGLVVLVIGALVAAGWLTWFGRLPGDIRYERGGTRVYVPITSMVLVSLLLTLASYVIRRIT